MTSREIPGYPGYEANTAGDIHSFWGRGPSAYISAEFYHKLTPQTQANGYLKVFVRNTARKKMNLSVHRAVCITFRGIPFAPQAVASHLNGDNTDNRLENLIWETQKENLARREHHGTSDIGCKNSRASLNLDSLEQLWGYAGLGWSNIQIADELIISKAMVGRILRGDRYNGAL